MQPSSQVNNPTPTQTQLPAPTPVPTDNPTFNAKVSSQEKIGNLIIVDGTLNGVSAPQDIVMTCNYPNGKTLAITRKNVSNYGNVFYPFETKVGGLGAGYITVSLASTGKVLAKYNFTVIEQPR